MYGGWGRVSEEICISVQYYNMLRARAGIASEMLDLPDGATLRELLHHIAETHGPVLREMLFTREGAVQSHLVVFRNRELLPATDRDAVLADGDELMLFPAIAGG